jgi:hypothetical protein
MPPGPLTPTFRLVFNYTVSNLAHKAQLYCDCVASGDVSGFDVHQRASLGDAAVSDVSDALWGYMAPFFKSTDTQFGSVIVQERTGTIWNFVGSYSTAVTPSGSTAFAPAFGFVVSMKSVGNQNMPFSMYEGPFGSPSKTISFGALSGAAQDLIDALTNTNGGAVSGDPYNWRLSRSGGYAGRWIAEIVDTNEKLRRIRGIK